MCGEERVNHATHTSGLFCGLDFSAIQWKMQNSWVKFVGEDEFFFDYTIIEVPVRQQSKPSKGQFDIRDGVQVWRFRWKHKFKNNQIYKGLYGTYGIRDFRAIGMALITQGSWVEWKEERGERKREEKGEEGT